jgi:hypothetical protein
MQKSVIYTHEIMTRSGRAFKETIKWVYSSEVEIIGTRSESDISLYDREDETNGITLPVLAQWKESRSRYEIVRTLDSGDLPDIELVSDEF